MKLDYSKTLNEQRDTIENILNENKHYSLQLSQLQQLCDKYEKEQSTTFKVWLSVIDEHRQLKQEKEELIKYCEEKLKINKDTGNDYWAGKNNAILNTCEEILSKLKESDNSGRNRNSKGI